MSLILVIDFYVNVTLLILEGICIWLVFGVLVLFVCSFGFFNRAVNIEIILQLLS